VIAPALPTRTIEREAAAAGPFEKVPPEGDGADQQRLLE
jgi:hypothetical protein